MECAICLTDATRWDEMCVEHHRVCVKCSISMRLAKRQVVNHELVVACPFCRRPATPGLPRHHSSIMAEKFIQKDKLIMSFLESMFMITCFIPTAVALYCAAAYLAYFLNLLFSL